MGWGSSTTITTTTTFSARAATIPLASLNTPKDPAQEAVCQPSTLPQLLLVVVVVRLTEWTTAAGRFPCYMGLFHIRVHWVVVMVMVKVIRAAMPLGWACQVAPALALALALLRTV